MKRLIFIMCFLMAGVVGLTASAHELGVFANYNTNCIQFINPSNSTYSCALLKGQLGSYGGGLLDVAITSDGSTAIVSNYDDRRIFFIDISNGFLISPILLGSVWINFRAEDLALTPDDKYVLVTDGGLGNQISVVDVAHLGFVKNYSLGGNGAQAIAVAPDGQTVVVADYWGGAVHTLLLDAEGNLTLTMSQTVMPFFPVNIAISPDGQTVIVVTGLSQFAPVFRIVSPGETAFVEYVRLPSFGGQSCVFSNDGQTAYYLSNDPMKGTLVNVLNAHNGQVTPTGVSIAVEPERRTGHFYGVDTIALSPSGEYLYVTNPSIAGGERIGNDTGSPSAAQVSTVSVIDLMTNTQVRALEGTGWPTGIAFTTLPAAKKSE